MARRNLREWRKISDDDVRKEFMSAKEEYIKAREVQRDILVYIFKKLGLKVLDKDDMNQSKEANNIYQYTYKGTKREVKQSEWTNWIYTEVINEKTNDYYYISFQPHHIDKVKQYVEHFLFDRIGIFRGKITECLDYSKIEISNIDLPLIENDEIAEDKLKCLIYQLLKLNIAPKDFDTAIEQLKMKISEEKSQEKFETFKEIKDKYVDCRRWQHVKVVEFLEKQKFEPINRDSGFGPSDLKPQGTKPYDSRLLNWIDRTKKGSFPYYFISFQPFVDIDGEKIEPMNRRYLLDRIGLYAGDDNNQLICEKMEVTELELPLNSNDLCKLKFEISEITK